METQVFIEKKTLSDGSFVHNVVIDGQRENGVGTCRIRLICASQLDAETIEKYLACQIAANHLIAIE